MILKHLYILNILTEKYDKNWTSIALCYQI